MRESAEFRVSERFASKLFAKDEGTRLGDSIRKVRLDTSDPRFEQVGRLQQALRGKRDASFYYGWDVHRQYSRAELEAATRFQLIATTSFEPAGEECGTRYDESTACPRCGAGATQTSDLRLDLRKVPKSVDIACTIADEWIVSQRFAEQMIGAGLTGFEFRPVRHKARYEDDPLDLTQVSAGREIIRQAAMAGAPHPTGRFYIWLNRAEHRDLLARARAEYAALRNAADSARGHGLPVWHQLVVTAATADIVPPTRVGIDLFDDDAKGDYRCPEGDLIGLNVLSEVSIRAASSGDSDIVCSRQFVGVRRGLLRPSRVLLISQAFRRLIADERLRRLRIEVVHLV